MGHGLDIVPDNNPQLRHTGGTFCSHVKASSDNHIKWGLATTFTGGIRASMGGGHPSVDKTTIAQLTNWTMLILFLQPPNHYSSKPGPKDRAPQRRVLVDIFFQSFVKTL